jgi:hypothetical protein
MRFASFLFVTANVFESSRLTRLDVRRRKWLLPPFVRTTMPLPVTLNRLTVDLCVFSLYFLPTVCSPAYFFLSGIGANTAVKL